MKTAVAALAVAALLAFASIVPAEAAYCRVSSYALKCDQVKTAKAAMFKACNAMVTVLSAVDKGGCCIFTQQVSTQAAWDMYSACEKSAQNKANYDTLKAKSKACEANQKKGECSAVQG